MEKLIGTFEVDLQDTAIDMEIATNVNFGKFSKDVIIRSLVFCVKNVFGDATDSRFEEQGIHHSMHLNNYNKTINDTIMVNSVPPGLVSVDSTKIVIPKDYQLFFDADSFVIKAGNDVTVEVSSYYCLGTLGSTTGSYVGSLFTVTILYDYIPMRSRM